MLPLSFTNSPPRVVYHHLVLFCFIALHPLHYTQLIKSSTTMIYIVIISLVLVNLVYYICIIIIRLYLYVFIISLIFQTPQNWRVYHYPFTFFMLEFTLYGGWWWLVWPWKRLIELKSMMCHMLGAICSIRWHMSIVHLGAMWGTIYIQLFMLVTFHWGIGSWWLSLKSWLWTI